MVQMDEGLIYLKPPSFRRSLSYLSADPAKSDDGECLPIEFIAHIELTVPATSLEGGTGLGNGTGEGTHHRAGVFRGRQCVTSWSAGSEKFYLEFCCWIDSEGDKCLIIPYRLLVYLCL